MALINKLIDRIALKLFERLASHLHLPVSFAVLRIQEGDVIVVKSLSMLSERSYQEIIDQIKTVFPDHKVMVLDEGLELGLIQNK